MRMMRTSRTLIGALLAAVLVVGGCGGEVAAVHIGIAGPISRANGRSMQLAAEMAVEEINRAGGIDGRRVELVVKDDEADAEHAIEVATELRDDPRVVAVIGHVNSSATLAAASAYNAEPAVTQISPASSSPQISDAGEWTFRVCPTDLQHGPALADWASDELGGRRIAVLYANDAYGRGVLESFRAAVERHGAEVIAADPYHPAVIDDDRALDPYVERAIDRGMDVLMIAGQAEEAQVALAAARRLGFDGPVMGADGLTSITQAGDVAEGVFVSSAFLPDRSAETARAFVDAYRDRYGELPDHRGAMTYDAIRLVVDAVREVGTDRRAIRDYVAGVGGERSAFDGVSGAIAFDENGDVVDKPIAIGVVRDGQLVSARR